MQKKIIIDLLELGCQYILEFVDCSYDGGNGKVRNLEMPCGER
jgi:hypothetical protein